MVKRLSTVRDTWVRSLGQEDPLEKEMAIHSSATAWKIPWTEELGPWGRKELDTTEQLHFHFHAQETPAFFGRLGPSTASRGWDNAL